MFHLLQFYELCGAFRVFISALTPHIKLVYRYLKLPVLQSYELICAVIRKLYFKMTPNIKSLDSTPGEDVETKTIDYDNYDTHLKLPAEIGTDKNFKRKVVWFNAIGFLALHLAALYGYYLCFYAHPLTVMWMLAVALVSGLGVTIGAHRLYSHKSFKAKWPLRLALLLLQTVAGQNCMYIWVRDHRQHHKYSDTDADPHNANRGFFFSHMGWLMSKKHPAVKSKGKTIDMSDLEADPLVMIQKTFYKSLYVVFAMAIPMAIPIYLWNETYINSFFISYFARYILLLHITWSVNSWAHLWGMKPFDKSIKPVESKFVAFVSIGEGWHNYHHAFPWDYRAAEFGSKYSVTTFIINVLAATGLAYDLKVTPYTMVQHRAFRTGDGSHHTFGVEARKKYGKITYIQSPSKDDAEEDKATVDNNKNDLRERKTTQRPVIVQG